MSEADEVTTWIERQAKPCTHCKEVKSFSEFHKNKPCRTGVHSTCRKCRGIQGSQYQLNKAAENGIDVKECSKCELLFKSKNFKECKHCRTRNQNETKH